VPLAGGASGASAVMAASAPDEASAAPTAAAPSGAAPSIVERGAALTGDALRGLADLWRRFRPPG
jgi:hypothetical protein